ncbi:hypothetical protein ASD56_01970 [Microbacterium sp. Root166]|uniref:carbohydrate kinase family protein n=1 Tax=Microbacterium sp. Root166 TaxID=1736478 RepID=UPI0006F244DF|nr:carbohydrate kinase family protein [Microbacterium sp. Root166]KQZ85158.1 hypothetical protein ASD56_01970 [Microbacterium sp. Root166]
MAEAAGAVTDRLLVVGELCVDLIVGLTEEAIRFGQHEQLVPFTELTMGSSSAITACGAAAAGVPTTMVGVVGRDDFGDYIVRTLTDRGMDVSRIRVDASVPTGSSTHLTRPDGDRAILTAMGSIGMTAATDVPEDFAGAAHLHVGSYFLQHALWGDAAPLFARARAAGLSTSLDGNFDPDQTWDRGILEVIAHTDVFFGNEQELEGITGLSDPESAVRALLERMPAGAIVVRKLGADGALAATLDSVAVSRVHAAVPEVSGVLVDTVGAGDSLAAGFLAGRLSGLATDRSLALGVACGTASTRGAGGVGAQPDRATAEAIAGAVRTWSD